MTLSDLLHGNAADLNSFDLPIIQDVGAERQTVSDQSRDQMRKDGGAAPLHHRCSRQVSLRIDLN